jgi:hypothetical protein
MVPLAPSWVIGEKTMTIARLAFAPSPRGPGGGGATSGTKRRVRHRDPPGRQCRRAEGGQDRHGPQLTSGMPPLRPVHAMTAIRGDRAAAGLRLTACVSGKQRSGPSAGRCLSGATLLHPLAPADLDRRGGTGERKRYYRCPPAPSLPPCGQPRPQGADRCPEQGADCADHRSSRARRRSQGARRSVAGRPVPSESTG